MRSFVAHENERAKLQNLAKSEKWSVLTLDSLCLPFRCEKERKAEKNIYKYCYTLVLPASLR